MSKPAFVLSLYDYSGAWSMPYTLQYGKNRLNSYAVMRVDAGLPSRGSPRSHSTLGIDLTTTPLGTFFMEVWHAYSLSGADRFAGILAAPPCRVFCCPGARLWSGWDADGTTARELVLVDLVLACVREFKPEWWALENPPGRLYRNKGGGLRQEELGPPRLKFHPYEYAGWNRIYDDDDDRKTKYTYLWGKFNRPEKWARPPAAYPTHLPPGRRDPTSRKSSTWARQRARTPMGFAFAFQTANP